MKRGITAGVEGHSPSSQPQAQSTRFVALLSKQPAQQDWFDAASESDSAIDFDNWHASIESFA
jgi:hypothetical protein